ncbi:MAG: hypothetical protein HOQ24_14360 [Mycobacteriaceae bacterium]|nr:hypothetical protein [Mycobacteriaceae bacterium]
MDFSDDIGRTVILYGIAENDGAGAILRCGPDSHVYIDGLAEWSDSDVHNAFEVTGTLVERGSDADLQVNDNTVAHGVGRHFAVRNATRHRLTQ